MIYGSYRRMGLSKKSMGAFRAVIIGACFLIGPIAFVGCKASSSDTSKVKGLNDGGCNEYALRLKNLLTERDKLASKPAASEYMSYFLYTNSGDEPLRTKDDTVSDTSGSSITTSISTSPELKELDRKIEQARLDLSICAKNKAGEIDTVKIPGNGNAGHCDFNGQPYDILNYNCHSAANQSVLDSPFNTGIVSCRGYGPTFGDPSGHTFNYRVENNMIVYYNWGQTCKAPKKQLPPDISDPDHRTCARVFCGKQFSDDLTTALPVGQNVEEPGPFYCASNTSSKSACDSCCQYRGKYWDLSSQKYRPTDLTFSQFMSQCYNSCYQNFSR